VKDEAIGFAKATGVAELVYVGIWDLTGAS
jgi:hypothetical protein